MRLSEIKEKAEEMGVSLVYAITCRMNYLRQRQAELDKSLEEYFAFDNMDATNLAICNHYYLEGMNEFVSISKELHYLAIALKYKGKVKEDEITEEMIERARRHPIELILEFTRGKCRCLNPEHDDRNPSMFFANRTNHAICPVCDYKVDSIAAYQHVFSTDFRTAVKSLQ